MFTITVDFDDTLHTKAFPEIACKRLSFFRTLTNSGIFRVLVVTARTKNIEDICTFCKQHDIKIDGVISHAGDKLKVLQEVRTIAHFEDNEQIIRNLSENGINCFYTGEFLSSPLKEQWRAFLEADGTWTFYVRDNNTRGL